MRAMFEWKILAAIFAVLIVASSALVTQTGIRDAILNATGGLSDLMQQSPFSGFFSSPKKVPTEVSIAISADSITLDFASPVNITSPQYEMTDFTGKAEFRLKENVSVLRPAGTGAVSSVRGMVLSISNVRFDSISLSETSFSISGGGANITAESGDINIFEFSGTMTVSDRLVLDGNVTKVKDGNWEIGQ